MNNKRPLAAILNILAFGFALVMNYLAVALPLNNKTTGELSDQYPNLFTPAGFSFSIWGIIYLLLTGFVVYQAVVLFSGKKGAGKVRLITPFFIFNCLLNGTWIFAWHYEQVGLSVVIMLLLLVSLIFIHIRLSLPYPWYPLSFKIFIDLPFSIYLGWIGIATIANFAAWFTDMGIQPFGWTQPAWTITMIIAGTVIALLMLWRRHNMFFSLVPAWAFYGIVAKRTAAGDESSLEIAAVAQVCMYIILVGIVVLIVVRKLNLRKTQVKEVNN